MTWVAWRQGRAQILVAIIATRSHIAATPEEDLSTMSKQLQLLGTVLIGVPAAIGAFWGAPLLARELELGTHRLAWTQGVTRRKWLGTKLIVLAAAAVLVSGVFAALFTWWSLPLDAHGNRIGTANFGQRGIAPIAYSLFALALGTLVGTVTRRTLPAMATTLIGYFIARFTFQWVVRPQLVDTVTVTGPTTMFGPPEADAPTVGAWVLSNTTVDATGRAISSGEADRLMVEACGLTRDSSAESWARCADEIGIHDVAKVHPGSHFWPLQVWESAVFIGLAVALVLAAFWWIRHRTA
jgi:ABC-type transport system involved in multi-copper enzyme maturation permease subunit